ncbi:hypothetical protein PoB_004907600 [Plakobranchus ocellatus]|uniref:Uncharacterized protein n=1 Tax=Plakobranchus ocellatus TaxID=259542 RepID=A0AAV4BGU9_9GAST|nr:hypothetical protein PoB_004907600 [Plakobranchus ocellatus]
MEWSRTTRIRRRGQGQIWMDGPGDDTGRTELQVGGILPGTDTPILTLVLNSHGTVLGYTVADSLTGDGTFNLLTT